ncbi:DUF7916 family protein [Symbiobacterium terraclitae]|uniref:DUF7916 family protein n=1 Tax=Symbiobacterium terraclitae TaxID=557451 RepID=UPI0035B524B5
MRLLDMPPSGLTRLTRPALLEGIRLSEGRLVVAETVVHAPPLVDGVSNAELAAAFGADILLLNCYDCTRPAIAGLPEGTGQTCGDLKALVGRPVGVNLEPSDRVPPGRRATPENAARAVEQGADFICLTGNPHTMVTNESILEALRRIRQAVGDRAVLIAGRMHAAGVGLSDGRGLLTPEEADAFVDAGADVLLVPAPGTVPGATVDGVRACVQAAHRKGALALSAIGTSQEGADEATIRQLALYAKMAGVDLHHLGDAGYFGVAVPENILAYCLAVKGRRHTYRRMAFSARR